MRPRTYSRGLRNTKKKLNVNVNDQWSFSHDRSEIVGDIFVVVSK